MEEVESYPESELIKLWKYLYKEDWKRYGATFEDGKDEIDKDELRELKNMYSVLGGKN